MTYATDLIAAQALFTARATLLDQIVNGPASGAASLVTLPNGSIVKTIARVAAELSGGYASLTSPIFTQSITIGDNGAYGAGSIFSDANWGMLSRARRASPTIADFGWRDSADVLLMTLKKTTGLNVDATGNTSAAFHQDLDEQGNSAARRTRILGSNFRSAIQGEQLSGSWVANDLILNPNGGNVGFGATAPGARIHAKADSPLLMILDRDHGTNKQGRIEWRKKNTAQWGVGPDLQNDGTNDFFIFDYTNSNARFLIDTSGHILPGHNDNNRNLGSASYRMATIYAGTGTINTSDARHKQWRGFLKDNTGLVAVGRALPKIFGTFQFLDAIAAKGQKAFDALSPEQQANTTPQQLGEQLARFHTGLTVQDLVAIFDTLRLTYPELPTPAELGLYGRDTKLTKVSTTVTRDRPLMVDEEFDDVVYEEQGDHFVVRVVPGSRKVPAPPILKAVRNADGTPRLVQQGYEQSGVLDGQGNPVMQPKMVPEIRPVPQMEAYEDTVEEWVDQGEYILSTRPDEIFYLVIGAQDVAIEDLAQRVAALEAA